MIAGMQFFRQTRYLIATFFLLPISIHQGCSRSENGPGTDTERQSAYAASGGLPTEEGVEVGPGEPDPGEQPSRDTVVADSGDPNMAVGAGLAAAGAETASNGLSLADDSATVKPRLELRADLSPADLIKFLASTDEAMHLIMTGRSGITSERQASSELIRIVKLKREASRRLSESSDANSEARSEGARGELQALSHLASHGDVNSAIELEALAKKNLLGDDPRLASDSRLVLIGFAIESLQNGDQSSAQRIVDLVSGFSKSSGSADVAALMVMAEAREVLARNDQHDEAKKVREAIIDLYADSSDPQIAAMATEVAGNPRFDDLKQLLASAIAGDTVSTSRLQESVETLIEQSANLQTVEFLAYIALEFESLGQDDLVAAVFESLASHFDDPQSPAGREVELAISLRQARKLVIGRPFDLDLPGVGGTPLRIDDYRGKVVLMPFWSAAIPASLQLTPLLKRIVAANGDDVVIVGMNMDSEDVPVEEFLQGTDLDFPNFRAAFSPSDSGSAAVENANAAIAEQFGIASIPFLAVLDQEGHVAAISFAGRDLEETVRDLLVKQLTGDD